MEGRNPVVILTLDEWDGYHGLGGYISPVPNCTTTDYG